MRLDLTEEQQMIQATVREFADSQIKPIAADIDRDARFPHETVKGMGELGLMGMVIPEQWGGSGAGAVSYVVALEEIAKACATHAVIMSVNNSLYGDPVYRYGTDAQRERFLRPVASGHAHGCFALTEPQAGSDATNQATLAVRDGDHYVVEGRKRFITTGREAAFGVPIGEHQMIQWMLADMAVSIDGARLLTWRAAALKEAGRPYGTAAAMAKLFAAETAMKVTTDAIQVHGGYGFIKEYGVERAFRDAKITQLYEGTSQIQKLVIARDVLRGGGHDGA